MTTRMENEMTDVNDRIEITELLNRHQIYIDLAEAERYAGLFAPDGVYESPFASATGRAEIAKMFRGLSASRIHRKQATLQRPVNGRAQARSSHGTNLLVGG